MSAKILYTLSEENPDLHNKLGCLNGIFQLFEGHRFHHSRRVASHGHHKRLPPGRSQTSKNGSEPSRALHETLERTSSEAEKEKQTVSSDSPRSSFSSSRCLPSFSSADNYYGTSPLEPSFFGNGMYQETHGRKTPTYQSNGPSGLRDVVKDSIHREARRVMVRNSEEKKGRPKLNYIDSPRPMTQANFTKNRVSLLDESFQNRLHKDSPRLSYDERELRPKSTTMLQELPRLSLDGMEQCIRSCSHGVRQNYGSEDRHRRAGSSSSLDWRQEPEMQGRTSSVVAKLMGLEVLPDLISPGPETALPPQLSGTHKNNKQSHFSNSPRHARSKAATTRVNVADYQKPVVTAGSPMEPSQPKQPDDREESYIVAPETQRTLLCAPVFVTGEIENVLAQIQPKELRKDLIGILKAMEKTKQMLEGSVETNSNSAFLQKSNSPALATNMEMDLRMKSHKSPTMVVEPTRFREKANSSTSRSTSKSVPESLGKPTSNFKSSKKHNGKQTAEDLAPSRNHHRGASSQRLHNLNKNISARPPQHVRGCHSAMVEFSKSRKMQGNHSLQQKHLGLEEQHHQVVPSTDLSKSTRHPSGQQTESGSPIRIPGPKLQIPKQTESGIDQGDRGHRTYATSLQSKSNTSMLLYANTAITRNHGDDKTRDASVKHTPKQKNSAPGIRAEKPRPDHMEVVQEQPSPVSVLDAIFYGNESPSPVKKTSSAFKDEEHLNSEEAGWACEDQNEYSHTRGPSLSSEYDPNPVLANSTPAEVVVQETAILHESKHTEHKYIFEILLISGILKDPESSLITTQLCPSCPPLSPDLFLALEQGKASMEVLKGREADNESGQIKIAKKVRRKLIFDTVNEILMQKIVFRGFSEKCIPLRDLSHKKAKRHMILQTLCSEIDRLQAHNSNCKLDNEDYSLKNIFWNDLMHQEPEWTDLKGEIPGVALEVERLIFKDLISEVVGGETAAAAARARPGRHHRRLSSA